MTLSIRTFFFLLLSSTILHATDVQKILIGCPVVTEHKTLCKCLEGLAKIEHDTLQVNYLFICNDDRKINALLHTFTRSVAGNVTLEKSVFSNKIKTYNHILQKAITENYDYLFLINSDITIHPKTITHLISCKKEIICENYWIKSSNNLSIPQVWMHDDCCRFNKEQGEKISSYEINKRKTSFLAQLKTPGIYEVGGLESCILISKKALHTGINFNDIYNISFKNCFVHFCLRAAALNLNLFVDTTYPASKCY